MASSPRRVQIAGVSGTIEQKCGGLQTVTITIPGVQRYICNEPPEPAFVGNSQ